jgi:amidase
MAMKQWYLFDVNPQTPPAFEIDSGEVLTLEVRGAFADVPDVREVPTPFTPACDGHPRAPITGPVKVLGAEPGDGVVIDLLEITPHGEGKTAILRDFGVLRQEFREPVALACPIKDGRAWFGGRIPLPLSPNLGTVSTMPVEGYRPAYAGPYGGDFDQKDVRAGSRVHLPVLVPGALVFFADPHAAISDGIIGGTGVECDCTVQVLGFGPTVEAATEDAARAAVDYTAARTGLDRREAYMLLSIVGELRVGTSPRPVMAARLIIPREVLDAARR